MNNNEIIVNIYRKIIFICKRENFAGFAKFYRREYFLRLLVFVV